MSNNPWGLQNLKPGVHKTINADKLKKFERGYQPKRNKFKAKQKEEAAKRKRAQEEAAKAYEAFVQSFEVNENATGNPGMTFVEGGTMGGTASNPKTRNDPSSKGKIWGGSSATSRLQSSGPGPAMAQKKKKSAKSSKGMNDINPFASMASVAPARKKRRRGEKPKSNMESFLEEMKRESAMREERKRRGIPEEPVVPMQVVKGVGHHDTGDPTTTNIYVGNISPQVSEEFLVREFGKFGDVASVKIMWPRTPEEHSRNRNCGFVSFMKRKAAENALNELQGKDYFGFCMRLGWGKKVNLPSMPLRIPKPGETLLQANGPIIEQAVEIPRDAPRNIIMPPKDGKIKGLIDSLARYVAVYGHVFEKVVMNREMKNPRFFFLYQAHTLEHMYYRWRVYSLSNGDTEAKWRAEPFQMIYGGPYWFPPSEEEMAKIIIPPPKKEEVKERDPRERSTSRSPVRRRRGGERGDRDRERRDRRKKGSSRRLRSRERDEFEDRLRGLTLNRTKIAYGMGFALDHAEEAKEIVEIITESLSLDETPIPKKVARLFLVSDILYNSTAPVRNASAYRTEFRDTLPKIFNSLHRTYKNIEGRITANAMRERVTKVLRVWQVWSLFTEKFVNDLESTFLGKEANQKIVAEAAQSKQQPKPNPTPKPETKAPPNLLGGAYDSDDDETGENNGTANRDSANKLVGLISGGDEDIDGAPIDGEDIDGEPVDDVDGEPVDDDIDGVPI